MSLLEVLNEDKSNISLMAHSLKGWPTGWTTYFVVLEPRCDPWHDMTLQVPLSIILGTPELLSPNTELSCQHRWIKYCQKWSQASCAPWEDTAKIDVMVSTKYYSGQGNNMFRVLYILIGPYFISKMRQGEEKELGEVIYMIWLQQQYCKSQCLKRERKRKSVSTIEAGGGLEVKWKLRTLL